MKTRVSGLATSVPFLAITALGGCGYDGTPSSGAAPVTIEAVVREDGSVALGSLDTESLASGVPVRIVVRNQSGVIQDVTAPSLEEAMAELQERAFKMLDESGQLSAGGIPGSVANA